MRTARPAVRICFQRVIRVMRATSFGEPNFTERCLGRVILLKQNLE